MCGAFCPVDSVYNGINIIAGSFFCNLRPDRRSNKLKVAKKGTYTSGIDLGACWFSLQRAERKWYPYPY